MAICLIVGHIMTILRARAWDKKQRYKWDRQPITSEQISLIHKLAPDYKIDTKKMTRGDASRVIQLLAYAPKEQDAQEQAQEVQDDAT